MKKLLAFLLLLSLSPVRAAVVGKAIRYTEGSTVMEGYLTYDDALTGKRPGMVIFPDWMGMGDFPKARAEDLARMGFVALAADVYGIDGRPKDMKEAGAAAGKYKADRPLLRARAQAALQTLIAQPQTDSARLAAMGYCFGGMAALELARSGVPIAGVISFHGSLDTPHPEDAKNIKGKVLVLHGADDPHVPPEQVQAFEKEMRDAHVDWQLNAYGGAVHAFTNPAAGNDNSKGVAYNESAARRSWQAMKDFLAELFPSK